MKIGFESTIMIRANKTGVDKYGDEIIRRVVTMAPQHQFVLSYFALPHRPAIQIEAPDHNVKRRRIAWFPLKIYNGLYKYLFTVPFDLIAGGRADVYVFPNFVRWPIVTKKSIIVIHDLTYLKHPQYLTVKSREFLQKFVPRSIAKSQGIIAVSEHTKRDLVEAYGVDPDRIGVVPNAVDHEHFYPRPDAEVAAVRQKFELARPYLLLTGTIEPRKNVDGLLQAFAALPPALRDQYVVVLAGGKGWLDEGLQELIARLRGAGLQIVQTGYVPLEDLPPLMSGATAFVLPSHYEGFGIPLIEAMACGTPVITTDNSSLPEVVADAGLIVPTGDTPALTAAMERLLSDSALQSDLRARGLERAKVYTWEASARAMLEFIERIAAN